MKYYMLFVMKNTSKNFLYFYFVVLFCLVGCDIANEKKYLSSKVDVKDIKKLTTPIDEDFEIDKINIQKPKKKQEIIIPDSLKQPVSLSLSEKLPIKSVLCEAAKKLNIDFQMDPSIDNRIIFSANNRPFINVLDAVCDMADLRYSINNNFVSVVKDTPYNCVYDVQFLNLSRDSENNISIATEVSSGASPENSGSDSKSPDNQKISSSDSSVSVRTKNDFWGELENGIKIILQDNNKDNKSQPLYSINKQSGIITVYANSKTQNQIQHYINKVKNATTSQVLIEAKIIEVVLKSEYRRGIDWGLVGKKWQIGGNLADNSNKGLIYSSASGNAMTFGYNNSNSNMKALLNVLEEFGSMRTISNPRITAMNNQSAVLKVAQNHVYFKLNYDKTYGVNNVSRDGVSISSDIRTVPIGLVMFVQPSIDVENDTITLFLRPTISKLSGTVNDPAVDITLQSISDNKNVKYQPSMIPITEVREVSSILKLKDGEIAVLGGFMEVRSAKNKSGLPFVSDVPIVGEASSSYGTGDEVVELVILIKVRIAKDQENQKATDIRLQRFVPDPRPF